MKSVSHTKEKKQLTVFATNDKIQAFKRNQNEISGDINKLMPYVV